MHFNYVQAKGYSRLLVSCTRVEKEINPISQELEVTISFHMTQVAICSHQHNHYPRCLQLMLDQHMIVTQRIFMEGKHDENSYTFCDKCIL